MIIGLCISVIFLIIFIIIIIYKNNNNNTQYSQSNQNTNPTYVNEIYDTNNNNKTAYLNPIIQNKINDVCSNIQDTESINDKYEDLGELVNDSPIYDIGDVFDNEITETHPMETHEKLNNHPLYVKGYGTK